MTERPQTGERRAESARANALAAFTIVTKSHLASALALMDSLARHMPDARRYVLLADTVGSCFDVDREPFTVIEAETLAIPAFRQLAFHYSPMELCCALKPWGLRHLLEGVGFGRALYLDSDILLYGPPLKLTEQLDQRDIVLTPHLLDPQPAGAGGPPQEHILRDGTYNAGVVAARDSATTRRFARWWCEKLAYDCVVDVRRGLMYDQKWLDMVPALFPGTGLLREPGYNIAYWNLPGRPITRDDAGRLLAAGSPLALFHFSYYRPGRQERPFGPVGPALKELGDETLALLDDYDTELRRAGREVCAGWPYAYGAFSDGTPVHPAFRAFCREVLHPRGEGAPEDPFSSDGEVMRSLTTRWRDTPWVGAVAALYRHIIAGKAGHPGVPLYDPLLFARWCVEQSDQSGMGEPFAAAQLNLLENLRKGARSDAPGMSAGVLALLEQADPANAAVLCMQFDRQYGRLTRILNRPSVRLFCAARGLLRKLRGAAR